MDDEPTIITKDDIDKVVEMLLNSEIKKKCCLNCGKHFFPNYHDCECDECFFSHPYQNRTLQHSRSPGRLVRATPTTPTRHPPPSPAQ